eukprot:31011-Pelagococcus_subviridis.AAC.4
MGTSVQNAPEVTREFILQRFHAVVLQPDERVDRLHVRARRRRALRLRLLELAVQVRDRGVLAVDHALVLLPEGRGSIRSDDIGVELKGVRSGERRSPRERGRMGTSVQNAPEDLDLVAQLLDLGVSHDLSPVRVNAEGVDAVMSRLVHHALARPRALLLELRLSRFLRLRDGMGDGGWAMGDGMDDGGGGGGREKFVRDALAFVAREPNRGGSADSRASRRRRRAP